MESNVVDFKLENMEDAMMLNAIIADAIIKLCSDLGLRETCVPLIEALGLYRATMECSLSASDHELYPISVYQDVLSFSCSCKSFGHEQVCHNAKSFPKWGSYDSDTLNNYISNFATKLIETLINPKINKVNHLYIFRDVDGFDVPYMRLSETDSIRKKSLKKARIALTSHIKQAITIFRKTGRFIDETDDDIF